MPGSSADPLHKLLDEAESELSRRLQEACEAEAQGVSSESTAEIRRLEDTLLQAAMAAERTIAARRHLEEAPARDASPAAARDAKAPPADVAATSNAASQGALVEGADSTSTVVRQFEDETGRRWRAWPVIPDVRRAQTSSLRGLGDYKEGWICFEALDDTGRRRLPGRGRRWSDVPPEELPRLLAQAIVVPARKGRAAEAQ